MTPLPQRLRPEICDDALQNPLSQSLPGNLARDISPVSARDISQSPVAKLAANLAATMALAAKMALAAQSGGINGAGGKARLQSWRQQWRWRHRSGGKDGAGGKAASSNGAGGINGAGGKAGGINGAGGMAAKWRHCSSFSSVHFKSRPRRTKIMTKRGLSRSGKITS
eukprot:gene14827-biopygen6228